MFGVRSLAVGVPLERLLSVCFFELRGRTARRLQSEKFVGPPRRLGSFRLGFRSPRSSLLNIICVVREAFPGFCRFRMF